MKSFRGDRKDDRNKAVESDQKKPYQTPAWEEEKILEKTALACSKITHPPCGLVTTMS